MTDPVTGPVTFAEAWRGGILESAHLGHAVVADARGGILRAWGDPGTVVFPRSACKMIQALPLVESGAAPDLDPRRLALACASHQGAPLHVGLVTRWLADLGLTDSDLRCGAQETRDRAYRDALVRAWQPPCQVHNNCSGKHAGFLQLARHLGAGPEYHEPDHPVQRAVRDAFEDVTGEPSPGYGIDGCSAPNFATTLAGLARAMARFAAARPDAPSVRDRAAARLRDAMIAHPELVAGEGRACTLLMRATRGRAAVKTGAEAVFVAILPQQGLGVALKVMDGADRASECAIAMILAGLGVLDRADPAFARLAHAPVLNRRGLAVGEIRPGAALGA